jgi:hypothetical protein
MMLLENKVKILKIFKMKAAQLLCNGMQGKDVEIEI